MPGTLDGSSDGVMYDDLESKSQEHSQEWLCHKQCYAPAADSVSLEKAPERSRCFRPRMRSRSWAAFSNSKFLAASRIWVSSFLSSSASCSSLRTFEAAASSSVLFRAMVT